MAVSQEIFRAVLTVETNIIKAVESLNELAQASERAATSLRGLSTIEVRVDAAGIQTIVTAIENATQEIRDDFEKLRDEVVTHSTIKEMMAEIVDEFAKLPNQTAPEVKKLRQQFEDLRTAVKPIQDAMAVFDRTTRETMDAVTNEILKLRGHMTDDDIQNAMAKIGEKTLQTGEEVRRTIEDFKQLKDAIQQVGLAQKPLAAGAVEWEMDQRAKRAAEEFVKLKEVGEKTFADFEQQGQRFRNNMAQSSSELGETNAQIDQFQKRFMAIGEVATQGATGFRAAIANIRGGLQLITADGGNVALGLRQVFFGLEGSTNNLGRALSWLGGRQNELSRATGSLERETLRISETMRRYTTGMRDQVDVLKEVGARENIQKSALNEIDRQVKKVENSFEAMNTTIVSGGKPTEHQTARVRESVNNLEQSFEQLVAQGIVPAGSKTADLLELMIGGARKQAAGTDLMIARQKALRQEVEEAEQSERKANQTSEQRVGIFKRITLSFGNLFNITKNVREETGNFNKTLDQTSHEITVVASTANIAKGAFLGFVGAIGALTGLRYVFNDISFALRRIAGNFLEVNNTAQNFEITLTNMLRGSQFQDQAEEIVGGALNFIKKQVADTPFELADAIEAFQRLIIAGLDPEQWITPIADAAAIMNKPMDQLIGAFQRLTVGDTGQALMMMRDFGINVNRAAIYVDQATGALLSQAQAIEATRMSTEELASRGWAKLSLEFSKGGELTTDTATALRILNGYLTQNATIAGTAASRSASLQGVMSNLKDSVSNLFIEMGKPIMEKLTSAGSGLLKVINDMQPVLNSIAASIGTTLANAVDSAVNFVGNFRDTFSGVIDVVGNVVSIVLSIFSGDWQNAWNLFLDAISTALDSAVNLFSSWVTNAFTWGWNFVVEIANGIVDAASSVLVDSLNYVGDLISSFLAPGSPPEVGPLSTIDKWGSALMDIFGAGVADINDDNINTAMEEMRKLIEAGSGQLSEGFYEAFSQIDFRSAIQDARKKLSGLLGSFGSFDVGATLVSLKTADFSFLRDALAPIKDFFKSMGSEGLDPFMRVRESMVAIVAELNETGQVNEEAFAKISEVLGSQNKELARYLRLQLELQAAQKRLADAQNEVAAAEARGFVPADLKARLAASEQDVQDKKEAVDWQKEYVGWQKETNQLQQEFLGSLNKATKALGKAASASANAAKARGKEIVSLEDWYAREKELIEEKYRLGVLGEREYVQALLSLEKQYVDRSLEEGIPAGIEAHVAAIKELEARLEALKESTKAAQGQASKGIELPAPSDILAPFAKYSKAAQEAGESVGNGFVLAMRQAIPRNIPALMSDMWTRIRDGFVFIFNNIREFLEQNVTPQNFPIFALLAGLFASLAGSSIFGLLKKFAGALFGSAEGAGLLSSRLFVLVARAAKLASIGGLIVAVLLNWDEIMAYLAPIIEKVSAALRELGGKILDNVIDKLGGIDVAGSRFEQAFEAIRELSLKVVNLFMELPRLIAEGDFSGIGQSLGQILGDALVVARDILIPIVADVLAGIWQTVYTLLPEQTQGVIDTIATAFSSGNFGTIASTILAVLGGIFSGIANTVVPSVVGMFSSIGQFILSILPPGVVDALREFGQAIADFFSQGRLGGELVGLFQALGDALAQIAPIAKVFGIALGVVAAIIGNVLLSSFQAFVDVLPYVERALAGLVRVITGAVEIITGWITLFRAAWAFLTGDTEQATQLVQQAFGKMRDGLFDIFSGLVEFLVGLWTGIVAGWVSFMSNLLSNVDAFLPQIPGKFRETFGQIVEFIVGLKDKILNALLGIVDGIVQYFTNLYNVLVGGSIVPELVDDIVAVFTTLPDQLLTLMGELMLGLVTTITDQAQVFLDAASQIPGFIQSGIENAWGNVTSWFGGKVDELLQPILGARQTIENAWSGLREGVAQPVEGARNAVVGAFGTLGQGIGEKTGEATSTVVSIFDSMRNLLVGNSIIPETTLAITNLFTTMNMTLSTGLQVFTLYATNLWQQFTTNVIIMWQEMVQFVVDLANQMEAILTEIIQRIVDLFYEWKAAVDAVLESLGKLPVALEVLGDYVGVVQQMIDKFNKWGDVLDRVSDKIQNIIERMDRLSSMSLPGEVGSAAPPAQSGIWRVPGTSTWTLHAGETVLPPRAADAFRSLMSTMNRGGVGAMDFRLPTMQAASPGLGLGNQITFGPGSIAVTLPNVRDGRDARSLVDQLNNLASQAALRGTVVG